MAPQTIGPYRILETLGSGGVGTVYRSIDRRTGEVAALKLLSTGPALDSRSTRRLAREFETLQRLSHPNVVRVYDTGTFHGYPYLAMELIEGLTLKNYLSLAEDQLHQDAGFARALGQLHDRVEPSDDREADEQDEDQAVDAFSMSAFGDEAPSEEFLSDPSYENDFETGPDRVRELAAQLDEPDTHSSDSQELLLPFESGEATPPRQAWAKPSPQELITLNTPERVGRLKDAISQLCEALAYIHGYGLIHRDLKPSNVMVDEDRTVRLMDFGLAKYISDDAAVTGDGRLVGTFRYMAPEQILGERLDTRTDLYSLGIILYELICGRPPFDARTPYELWQKVLETDPIPVQTVNPAADQVLARVAMRLIRKEPDERFQTAEEVAEALNA
jgi:eukaryotic-like serine/threonine-protein kinase